MATDYPGAIDSFSTKTDEVTDVMAADVNDLQDAVEAIETELGADPAGTAADVKTRLAQSLDGLGNLDFKAIAALTISGGSVTPTQNWHVIDTEGSGAADDLDTIAATNVTDGFILFLRQANDARDVTIKHDTGNIKCPGGVDITLADTTQVVMLIYDGTLTKWLASICPSNVALTNKANTWAAEQILTKSERHAYTSISTATTLDATQNVVDVDATSASVAITLPTAVGINGREYVIRKLDSSANTVTITPNGSETVNGSSDIVLDEQYESTIIYSDGANWMQLATGGGGGASSDLIEHAHTGSTDGGLLRIDTIAAPTDTTVNNSSTDAHGLLPKLSGTATEYMNGAGSWSTPSGGSASTDLVEHDHSDSDNGGLLRIDTIAAPTDTTANDVSLSAHGLFPKLPGTSDTYWNGVGEWATISGGSASSDLIEHGHTGAADGGALKLDDLQPPDNTTDLNASTDTHGLLPKLDGYEDNYLVGTGAWKALPISTTGIIGTILLAATSDVSAGTTDSPVLPRAVTPSTLAKSNYGVRFAYIPLNGSTALAAGDKAGFPIPAEMDGWSLVSVRGTCIANSSSDNTVIKLGKNYGATSLLSTNVTIEAGETDSVEATTQPVISSSDNPVSSTDMIVAEATSDCGAGMTYAGILTGWRLP
jgi:hypothetical protein